MPRKIERNDFENASKPNEIDESEQYSEDKINEEIDDNCSWQEKVKNKFLWSSLMNELNNRVSTSEIKQNSAMSVENKNRVQAGTGLNVIKSVLVPFYGKDGSVSYEVKNVVVPVKSEIKSPGKKSEIKSLLLNRNKIKRVNGEKDENKQREEKDAITEGKQKTKEEKEPPKEEVDQILENLRNICPFCQKRFTDEIQMQRHVRKVHNRSYTCNRCHKGYFSKVALEEHERSHEDHSYLECSICHLRYKRKVGLRHHQIRIHSNVEPRFICDYCGKRFKLKIDLGLHIERTHMNVTSICKFCGKSVKNIKHHEWQHEKAAKRVSFQYRCHLCPKKFRTSNNLENHLLMHKDGFKCNQCEEIFTLPSALEKHKDLKHRPSMLCTICEKVFYSRSNFYTHVLTHAGVRPYKCDVCGEDFTQRSSLIRHRRNHPGPLPPLTGTTQIADIARKILQKI